MITIGQLMEKGIVFSTEMSESLRDQLQSLPHEALLDALTSAGLLTEYQRNQIATGDLERLRIGHFVLLEPSGMGGMGQVFRARSVGDHDGLAAGEIVAIKLLLSTRQADPFTLQRFEREIEVVQRIKHPNVVRILEVIRNQEGQLAIVMPYMAGGDLEEYVRGHGPVHWRQSLGWIREAAEGLAEVHSAGILHRDIKPNNLLLDANGRVRVADFGVAKFQGSQQSLTGLTQTGGLVGTPAFLSPEAATGSRKLDSRSDLYSLGCVAHFLICAKPPFSGSNSVEVLLSHAEAPRPKLEVTGSEAGVVEATVHRWMAIDPHTRPSDARALIDDIDAILSGEILEHSRRERRFRLVRNCIFVLMAVCLVALVLAAAQMKSRQLEVDAFFEQSMRTAAATDSSSILTTHDSAAIAENWIGFFTSPIPSADGSTWSLVSNATLRGVRDAAWFADGDRICAIHGSELRVYDSLTGRLRAFYQPPRILQYLECDVAAGSNRIAALTRSNVVEIFTSDLIPLAPWTLGEAGESFQSLQWSPDGQHLAVHAADLMLILDSFGREVVRQPITNIAQSAWSDDSQQLAIANGQSDLRLLGLDGKSIMLSIPEPEPIDDSDSETPAEPASSTVAASVSSLTWVGNELVVLTSGDRLLRWSQGDDWRPIPHSLNGLSPVEGLCFDKAENRLRFTRSSNLYGLRFIDGFDSTFFSSESMGLSCRGFEVNDVDGRVVICQEYVGMRVCASDGRVMWKTDGAEARDPRLREEHSRHYEIGLAWTKDGRLLLASQPARLQLWTSAGHLVDQYQTMLRWPHLLARLDDETYRVVSDEFQMTHWNVHQNDEEWLETPRIPNIFNSYRFGMNSAGDCLIVADRSQITKRFDFQSDTPELLPLAGLSSPLTIRWHESLDQFFVTRLGRLQSQLCDREGKMIARPSEDLNASAAWIPGTNSLLLPTALGPRIWDSVTREIRPAPYGQGTPVYSPSGEKLIVIDAATLSRWDTRQEELKWTAGIDLELGSTVFSDDENLLAAVVRNNEAVVVIDVKTGHLKWCLLSADESDSIVFNGKGKLVWGDAGVLHQRASVFIRTVDGDSFIRPLTDEFIQQQFVSSQEDAPE